MIWVILLLLLDSQANGAPATTETYEYSQTLKTDAFILYWKYTTDTITFEVQVQTEGWVGIGISENSNMIGADLMVGWVKDGTGKITDRHSTANTLPTMDDQQDLTLVFAQETDGWTVVKFSRNLAGCEASSDREITSGNLRLIWAYGATDPTGDDITATEKHATANRGAQSIYLLDKPSELRSDGVAHQTLSLNAANFEIPPQATYYNCILHKLPDSILAEKHHVLKISPIVQSGNEAYVHHMLLHICTVPAEGSAELQGMEDILGTNKQCYTSGLPECRRLVVAWAVGGTALVYPDDTGLPIGSTFATYIWLETHYDNPSQTSGIIDSSGMSLTYTSDLQTHDIGTWQVGSNVDGRDNFIPPGATSFEHWGFCAGSCLSDSMAAASVSEVTMVGVMLHSHLAGVEMVLRHVRSDGTELEPIVDRYYDFDYQQTRVFDTARTVLPGDHIRLECYYDTSSRSQMTLSGLGTNDEMCLAFLTYYPRVDMLICVSYPLRDESMGFFDIEAAEPVGNPTSIYGLQVTAPATYVGQSVGEVMDNFAWTTDKRNDFQDALHAATQTQVCIRETGVTQNDISVPAISTRYVETRKTCPLTTTTTTETTAKTTITTTDSHGSRPNAPFALAFAATFCTLVFQKIFPIY